MRRFPSLTVVRAELRPWWRTRPLRSIVLGWFLAILITVLLLLVPAPFPIWGSLVFTIAWVSDDISTTRVLATLVFDVLTLLGVIAALVGSPWISAGSRRPAPESRAGAHADAPEQPASDPAPGSRAGAHADAPEQPASGPAPESRAGAGELLLAAWARSLAAWAPVAPLLAAATALGGATWSALILLLIFLTALTGAWCGIGLGAAALVRSGAAARALALAVVVLLALGGPTAWLMSAVDHPRPTATWILPATSPVVGISDVVHRSTRTNLWEVFALAVDDARVRTGGGARTGPGPAPMWPVCLGTALALGGAGLALSARRGRRCEDRARPADAEEGAADAGR